MESARPFLDVQYLLEASEPRRPMPRIWLLAVGLLLAMLISSMLSTRADSQGQIIDAATSGIMLLVLGGMMFYSVRMVRLVRRETQRVEGIGEMAQLRRWSEAAAELDHYLSAPARSWGLRAQALVFLAAVLARYQRYEDAIAVYDHLLDSGMIDPAAMFTLRLGRATAMLREDHLVDADRAISELRRTRDGETHTAGLALLELYRDVKTGHHADAIERFEKSLSLIRQNLGHRTADAWALIARSLDALGRTGEAERAFRNATLLAPPGELYRRYPEVEKLRPRFTPAYAPDEAA
jgi:tetratricopeptide (TPR) repeat protein